MKAGDVLVLTAPEVRALLTLDECIDGVESAFRLYGEGKAAAPAVLSLHVRDGGFHVKAGVLEVGESYFAAKVNGNFPTNPARFGLPTIQGFIVLCNADNGAPLAVMDSRDVTAVRTAAATAVAAKYLARKDARTVTICGCGEQGRAQLRALCRVLRLQAALAHDLSAERATDFARDLAAELKIPVTPAPDLSLAVRQSDVVVTCTPSQQPLLGANDVCAGTFVAAVGADNPQKQELSPDLMGTSKVVCDVVEQCASMGDLHHALKAGAMTKADAHAELGEIVAGKKPARETDQEVIVFDSTGMALQDVAAAIVLYKKAQREGKGARLSLAA